MTATTFENGFALIIGIENYHNVAPLPAAVVNDAHQLYTTLTSPFLCGFPPNQVRLLTNSLATKKQILDSLKWLVEKAKRNHTIWIYFSGHGGQFTFEGKHQGAILPHDFDWNEPEATAITTDELSSLISEIAAERIIIILDSCYANAAVKAEKGIRPWEEQDYTRLAQGVGRVVIAASRANEVSYVIEDMSNSLFTTYLLEALHGAVCHPEDGTVHILDVFSYLSDKMKKHGYQHPVLKTEIENNFSIALCSQTQEPQVSKTLNFSELRYKIMSAYSPNDFELLMDDFQEDVQKIDQDINVRLYVITQKDSYEHRIQEVLKFCEKRKLLTLFLKRLKKSRPNINI